MDFGSGYNCFYDVCMRSWATVKKELKEFKKELKSRQQQQILRQKGKATSLLPLTCIPIPQPLVAQEGSQGGEVDQDMGLVTSFLVLE